MPLERASLTLEAWKDRVIYYSEFDTQLGDRIVFFSDGVSQSGLGRVGLPLGWGQERVGRFPAAADRAGTGNRLARTVAQAGRRSPGQRRPRREGRHHLRQPFIIAVRAACWSSPARRSCERDGELAERVADLRRAQSDLRRHHGGHRVAAAWTARSPCLTKLDPEIPPAAVMEGVDLVTEGTITLASVAEMLDRGAGEPWRNNPARDLVSLMLQSDIVQFVVGTRINEAHQDPNVPVELDLRRNIVRRIMSLLESKHLKECSVHFV